MDAPPPERGGVDSSGPRILTLLQTATREPIAGASFAILPQRWSETKRTLAVRRLVLDRGKTMTSGTDGKLTIPADVLEMLPESTFRVVAPGFETLVCSLRYFAANSWVLLMRHTAEVRFHFPPEKRELLRTAVLHVGVYPPAGQPTFAEHASSIGRLHRRSDESYAEAPRVRRNPVAEGQPVSGFLHGARYIAHFVDAARHTIQHGTATFVPPTEVNVDAVETQGLRFQLRPIPGAGGVLEGLPTGELQRPSPVVLHFDDEGVAFLPVVSLTLDRETQPYAVRFFGWGWRSDRVVVVDRDSVGRLSTRTTFVDVVPDQHQVRIRLHGGTRVAAGKPVQDKFLAYSVSALDSSGEQSGLSALSPRSGSQDDYLGQAITVGRDRIVMRNLPNFPASMFIVDPNRKSAASLWIRSPEEEITVRIPETRRVALHGMRDVYKGMIAKYGAPIYVSVQDEVPLRGGPSFWHHLFNDFIKSVDQRSVVRESPVRVFINPRTQLRFKITDRNGAVHTMPVPSSIIAPRNK